MKPGPRYSWKKVVLILTLSCFSISGGATATYLFYFYVKRLQATDETSVIQAVVQTAGEYAPLQTTYLAEILELSQDRPANLSQFDLGKAKSRLLASHVIRKALIKKIKPNTLYLNYEVRKPIAFLGDYTNTAFDQEGFFFPYLPFYAPRLLPEVYIGVEAPPNPWGEKMNPKQIEIVRSLLNRFEPGVLKRIDLSQWEAPTAGKRQIVLVLEKEVILRLTPKKYAQELTNYFILADQMTKKAEVIDFRNESVAYIKYGE